MAVVHTDVRLDRACRGNILVRICAAHAVRPPRCQCRSHVFHSAVCVGSCRFVQFHALYGRIGRGSCMGNSIPVLSRTLLRHNSFSCIVGCGNIHLVPYMILLFCDLWRVACLAVPLRPQGGRRCHTGFGQSEEDSRVRSCAYSAIRALGKFRAFHASPPKNIRANTTF